MKGALGRVVAAKVAKDASVGRRGSFPGGLGRDRRLIFEPPYVKSRGWQILITEAANFDDS